MQSQWLDLVFPEAEVQIFENFGFPVSVVTHQILSKPCRSNLSVNVGHSQIGKVFFARGENRISDSLRTPYPSFAPRQQSQPIWVDGAAMPKSLPGLEVWTTSIQPNSTLGTTLKLLVKNGTSVPLIGLKVRYF